MLVIDDCDQSLVEAISTYATELGVEGSFVLRTQDDNNFARARLVSKIDSLLDQDLDYESFVEALVPSAPDLIILQGSSNLRGRVLEEAAYAEIVFIDKAVIELDDIKLAFVEFARRKRNFGV